MKFYTNELSLEKQFNSIEEFTKALSKIMKARGLIKSFGYTLNCSRSISNQPVIEGQSFHQVLQKLSKSQKLAVLTWTSKDGPFWEEERNHCEDDYIECNDDIITGTSIAEASTDIKQDNPASLVSFENSSWPTPNVVTQWHDDEKISEILVPNYDDLSKLEKLTSELEAPLRSWSDLENECRRRFHEILISEDAFSPIKATPFSKYVSERVIFLLSILEKLSKCNDENGDRNEEGHEIYQNFFTGDKALFSDSSDGEKEKFKKELTFSDPKNPSESLFCPLHAKIKSPQIRIHFNSISSNERTCITYVGPKITKN